MATYNWTQATSGDWNTSTLWAGGTAPNLVPNAIDADAVINVANPGTAYTVTIASGEAVTLASLTLNAQGDGTNSSPYRGAILEMDGTLTLASTGPGTIGGSLQTELLSNGGTFVNVGNLAPFTHCDGNVLFKGTNAFYVENELQATGTVTVDTSSIGELIQNTLTDGIYSAVGSAQGFTTEINLGGTLGGLKVAITKIQGPADQTAQYGFQGWTELQMNGPGSFINEWNGTSYVSVEMTLNDIGGGGVLEALNGRGYAKTSPGAMTLESRSLMWVDGGTTSINDGLVLNAGTASAIGGVFQGFGTITNGVTNNATMVALGGTLDIIGALSGTGVVQFDKDYENFVQFGPTQGTVVTNPTGATLEVGTVSAGQTIAMNGDDTLILTNPAAFTGTIQVAAGDRIVLQGISATSASISGGNLVVQNGSATVAKLHLAGSVASETFGVNGSTVTVGGTNQPPPPPQTASSDPLVPTQYYYGAYADVAAAKMDPGVHYHTYGWHEGRNPDAYFSTGGYLAANGDVNAAGMDPLTHYEQYGWKEGRDPSVNFDTELYLRHNPDVANAGIDPLQHYLQYGQTEGRAIYAAIGPAAGIASYNGFDAEYYLLANSDVAKAALGASDPMAFAYYHYETYGWHEDRDPNAWFDVKGYLNAYVDVAAANIDPLQHFINYGWKEGRDPSANFDTTSYLQNYGDVKAAGMDPLLHYLEYGAFEGRSTFGLGHFAQPT